MTKTAMENKKLDVQKEMQDKELAWKRKENKKDRIQKYVQTAGTLLAGRVKKNDPAWYKRYMPDLSKFTNIPTYHRLGVPFPHCSYMNPDFNHSSNVAIPGIMTIRYHDMIGPQSTVVADIPMNPVNQILMRSKEQVLKSNSRSSVNWEAADLGLNLFATASLITILGEYRRLILCAQTYSATNAYEGLGFLRAYGMSREVATQFISDLAAHRKNYLLLVRRFNNAVVAPADLTLFARKWYLATNIFADNSDKTRPQLYWFRTETAYKLNADGSKLNAVGDMPLVDANRTLVHSIYTFISGLISAIVENPDFQEMYADLRSAFGDRLIKIDESLDENAVIEYNVDTLNREQIRNLKSLPVIVSSDGFKGCEINSANLEIVSDTTGYLYQGVKGSTLSRNFTLTCANGSEASAASSILKHQYSASSSRLELYNVADLSSVTGDTVLDITRFKFTAEASQSGANVYADINVTDCGTEVVLGMMIYTLGEVTSGDFTRSMGTTIVYMPTTHATDVSIYEVLNNIGLYSAFDWSPNIMIGIIPEDYVTDAITPSVITIGDMTNTFPISHQDLSSLNTACVLSELYLDSAGFKR